MSPSAWPRTANATAELQWNPGGFYLLVVGASISPPGFPSPACSHPATLPTLLVNWPANHRQNIRSIRQNSRENVHFPVKISGWAVGADLTTSPSSWHAKWGLFLAVWERDAARQAIRAAPTCWMLLITSGQSACQQVGNSKLPEWEGKHDSVISFCS